jgi:Tfp pilus assembly protein PilN
MNLVYRINLYQEHLELATRARRRLGVTVALSVLTGLGLLAGVLILINGWMLRERNRFLESEIRRISSEIQARPDSPEAQVTSQLIQLRESRLLWSPKLSAVARSIGPSMRLLEITIRTPRKGAPAELQMAGVSRGSSSSEIVEFLGALREDPDVHRDLPLVVLGQLEEGGAGRFEISCQPAVTP